MLQQAMAGLMESLKFSNLIVMVIGVLVGTIAGALPGLTGTVAVIILLPFTYGMEAAPGLILMAASYCGAMYGGSISAILINTPGTPAAALTSLDGHPMARSGRGGEALGMAAFASFFGGVLSVICLLVLSRAIVRVAIKFGPPEYFLLAIFGLSILISLSKDDPVKGIISSTIGLLFGTVGMDIIDGTKRFTFGFRPLYSGLPMVPILIALLSMPHIFGMAKTAKEKLLMEEAELSGKVFPSAAEVVRLFPNLIRSSLIGVFIGALPGAGGNVASFLAYDTEKKLSKTPDQFGKGIIDGVAAAESANNGVTGGAIATMLSLGIPGSTVTAVMLGGLMMKGIQPGPHFFETAGDTAYTFIMSLFPANLFMLIIGILGARYFVKVVKCPNQILISIIIVLTIVGAYTVNNQIFDVYLMLGMGLFAYGMKLAGINAMPAVLGFILGPFAEKGIRQTAVISGGDYTIFFQRPACVALLVGIVFTVLYPIVTDKKRKKR